MSDFDSDPLTCNSALFTAKNSGKSNRIFVGKGRGERIGRQNFKLATINAETYMLRHKY